MGRSEGQDGRLLVDSRSALQVFYGNILKQDGLYSVLIFLHFSDNKNEHERQKKIRLTVENESFV
jgi:hypothetical protein